MKASLVPPPPIRALRDLTRTRTVLNYLVSAHGYDRRAVNLDAQAANAAMKRLLISDGDEDPPPF